MQFLRVHKKKIIQAVVFLVLGVALLAYVYNDIKLSRIKSLLGEVNYSWVAVSLVLNLLSQYIRAIRWRLLINPMAYRPSVNNLFLAILILGFTNTVIPRGGEIARSAVITKHEKIPFPKLMGTVVVERITDLGVLVTLFLIVLTWQFSKFTGLLGNQGVSFNFSSFAGKILQILAIGAGIVLVYFILKKIGLFKKFKEKIQKVKIEFAEGFRVLSRIDRVPLFFILSFAVYLIWFGMSYVMFFAYDPTSHLSFGAAAFTFSVATFAFVLPIQAGMGAWHFMVIQALLLFGIDKETGMVFALVAHTFTNLIYLVFGLFGFALLPILNKNKDS